MKEAQSSVRQDVPFIPDLDWTTEEYSRGHDQALWLRQNSNNVVSDISNDLSAINRSTSASSVGDPMTSTAGAQNMSMGFNWGNPVGPSTLPDVGIDASNTWAAFQFDFSDLGLNNQAEMNLDPSLSGDFDSNLTELNTDIAVQDPRLGGSVPASTSSHGLVYTLGNNVTTTTEFVDAMAGSATHDQWIPTSRDGAKSDNLGSQPLPYTWVRTAREPVAAEAPRVVDGIGSGGPWLHIESHKPGVTTSFSLDFPESSPPSEEETRISTRRSSPNLDSDESTSGETLEIQIPLPTTRSPAMLHSLTEQVFWQTLALERMQRLEVWATPFGDRIDRIESHLTTIRDFIANKE